MRRASLGIIITLSLMLVGVALSRRNTGSLTAMPRRGQAEFVVTNAADAGPGTLRDAILAADRLSNRARIVIAVPRIVLESALPPLVNPNGVSIEAGPGHGVIDADRLAKGAALQMMSPISALNGVSIIKAHDLGLVIGAAAVELEGLTISDSKVAVFLSAAATGTVIRRSTFDRNETAITADGDVREVSISGSVFRSNSRAALWFVGAAPKADSASPRASVKIVDGLFDKNASGLVLANRPTLVQKSRFFNHRESAVLILGGAARVEDCEFSGSGGAAVSVTGGRDVVIARNSLHANAATALMVRDSRIDIEHNVLDANGFGIVSVSSGDSNLTVMRDNTVTRSTGDAITVIGGSPQLDGNQLLQNHGAGLRILDLEFTHGHFKATPRLSANVVHGNGIDMPPTATYKLAGLLAP